MACTYVNILDGIINLLEGATGVDRTMPANTFKHFKSAKEFNTNTAIRNPRPFYLAISEPGIYSDLGNLSGEYVYLEGEVSIYIDYAYKHHEALELNKTIQEHVTKLRSVLTYPLNLALTDNWCGSEIETEYEAVTDDNGNVEKIRLNVTLSITYREKLE